MDKGRVAIVTGGGQGIGKAMVKRLLEDGLRVVIAEADAEAGRETLEEYHDLGESVFMHADILDEAAVKAVVRETVVSFRRVDVLINNAGVFINKPLAKVSLAEWNRVLAVNLTGTFLCAKYAAPHLAKSKGSVVNIASTRALMSEPDTGAYSASKGGMVALTFPGPQSRARYTRELHQPGLDRGGRLEKERHQTSSQTLGNGSQTAPRRQGGQTGGYRLPGSVSHLP